MFHISSSSSSPLHLRNHVIFSPYTFPSCTPSPSSSQSSCVSLLCSPLRIRQEISLSKPIKPKRWEVKCSNREPLRVMISGAPASGKGTQCQMIAKKFRLVHISTGDLLRAEVAAGTEIGNKAKEYMNTGRLVPDEILTAMVTTRLSLDDVKERGWLLDGYPRTLTQAKSLEKLGVKPDVYIVLEVPDEILIDRCVGRRLDPLTGEIYHIRGIQPESEDTERRLVTRVDDTEEKVKARLDIYKRNAEATASAYSSVLKKVDGQCPKDIVFSEISSLLDQIKSEKINLVESGNSKVKSNRSSEAPDKWRGIPTRLNNIPHTREIREYFYEDVLQATQRAVQDGKSRLKVEINIPELNPETDVYRIGTLMELVRVIALSFADDGQHVKVCVQGSMGVGALAGTPLQLAGTRKILEFMDWGDYDAKGTFINLGSIGPKEVEEEDDMFILIAPQNAVGNCIIDDMKAMTDAAGDRPVILINPRLKDLPASSGIMQAMGREQRLAYAASFENCYFFRLLYYIGTQYPIMGALRMSYPYPYEIYKRLDESPGKEKYVILTTFDQKPTGEEINDAFDGKPRNQVKQTTGVWGFLSGIFS